MQDPLELAAEVKRAARRIRAWVRHTPLELSEPLSDLTGAEVWLKLENLQTTGSFKLRGAANKLASLGREDRARGVVTASSGNHGMAVAHAARRLGCPATVFLAHGAAEPKRRALRRLGAAVRFHGDDVGDTERHARAWAAARGLAYVPPYNDRLVVAGQGTVGLEVAADLPDPGLGAVFVAVGGGGLIAGAGGYLRSACPGLEVVGGQPRNSEVMRRSVEAGRILELPSRPTLSDGTAGGIEPDAITFPLCQRWVDRFVSVTERQIGRAMLLVLEHHHLAVEGSAGVALAALLAERGRYRDRRVVVVLCGGNVSLATLSALLAPASTSARGCRAVQPVEKRPETRRAEEE